MLGFPAYKLMGSGVLVSLLLSPRNNLFLFLFLLQLVSCHLSILWQYRLRLPSPYPVHGGCGTYACSYSECYNTLMLSPAFCPAPVLDVFGSPFSALRSPLVALRFPFSALRSSLSAPRSPLLALRSSLPALRSLLSARCSLLSALVPRFSVSSALPGAPPAPHIISCHSVLQFQVIVRVNPRCMEGIVVKDAQQGRKPEGNR